MRDLLNDMLAPGMATGEVVHAYSIALNALAEHTAQLEREIGELHNQLAQMDGDITASDRRLANALRDTIAVGPLPDQRLLERAQGQLDRLNKWLSEHHYHAWADTATAVLDVLDECHREIGDLDTETADLLARLDAMEADNASLIARLHQEIDRLTRENQIAVDALNSLREAKPEGLA